LATLIQFEARLDHTRQRFCTRQNREQILHIAHFANGTFWTRRSWLISHHLIELTSNKLHYWVRVLRTAPFLRTALNLHSAPRTINVRYWVELLRPDHFLLSVLRPNELRTDKIRALVFVLTLGIVDWPLEFFGGKKCRIGNAENWLYWLNWIFEKLSLKERKTIEFHLLLSLILNNSRQFWCEK
jgi:hypothetical protein